MRPLSPTRRVRSLAFVAVAVVLVAASCSSSRPTVAGQNGSGPPTTDAATTTSTTLPAVGVLGTPVAHAADVPLDSPIVVKASGGTLTAVTVEAVHPDPVVTPAGDPAAPTTTTAPAPFVPHQVAGGFSADKTIWLGGRNLHPGTTYQVTATANGPGHRLTLQYWKFTTLTPSKTLHTSINTFNGATYGVGMPMIVHLSSPVDPSLRKAVEQRLKVTTSNGVQGSWRWFTKSDVHFRPANYWPAGTKVTLNVDFAGLNAGDGVWGVDGRAITWSVGDSHISTVDASTHTMTVQTNGATVRTIPVSTGRDKYPTHSGIHVVMTREPTHHMNSSTVGIPANGPGGYDETVTWAERISNSGEFVHSAPWSVGSQGSSNVSHGCVNVSTSDGHWFYDYSQIGDVVNVINTPNTLQPDNGYGDWQIPYAEWAN